MVKIIKETSGVRKRRVEGTDKERDTKWGNRSVRKQKRREKKRKVAKVLFLEGGVSRRSGSGLLAGSLVSLRIKVSDWTFQLSITQECGCGFQDIWEGKRLK